MSQMKKCFLLGKGYAASLLSLKAGSPSHVEPTVHTNVVGQTHLAQNVLY
jgi:hypothetical protein